MITMRMECAIEVEPMKSTLCRRLIKPWPFGYAHGVAWDGLEPSRGLLQRQVGYQLPHQAKKRVGEGGFEPPTARFQTAHADLTALLADDGGRVGHHLLLWVAECGADRVVYTRCCL